ncbi:hypothetical protein GOBAR_DD10030 [Gossypium barbadense]|nr:hypothetical protein GOBAR_DD10030 [Gossypium barbadense]
MSQLWDRKIEKTTDPIEIVAGTPNLQPGSIQGSTAYKPSLNWDMSAFYSMGSITKPHAVFVPYPAQGHVNPLMQLAKLLHSRGFYVTFVNTEFNHRRLVRSKGPGFLTSLSDFRFETISDGLPPSDRDATQDIWVLSDSVQKNCLGPFKELLAKLNGSSESPPVSCIVSDGSMSFTIKAAKEFGIPEAQFWTTSACGFMAYLHFRELIEGGIVPFKDENFTKDGTLDTPVNGVPGMSSMRLKDFPTLIRTTNQTDIMLNFMSPLSLLEKLTPLSRNHYLRSSLWKEDSKCLEWLYKRQANSVLFVSYGSITVMTDQLFEEFAWGLANSNHPFLWVVRPDMVMGNPGIFPGEYYKEIEGRGLIVNWCPQDQVLSHPSVGAFLTHCGWNSTLESISGGKPVICWPFFDEQPTNCLYLCNQWGIGKEISNDVKRDEVTTLVKMMMEGDVGKEMKLKALEWKKKAEEATNVGGSSYNNLNKFISDIL